jgi:acyl-CoA oxidase
MGLLHIRKIYSEFLLNADKYSKTQFNNVVRLVCAIKPLVAWHSNTVGNVCRERCGGQGYLSINRLEELIPFAHASITAEGDSAVLIHKVSKEYVDDFAKNLVSLPGLTHSDADEKEITGNVSFKDRNDILKIETLLNLIKLREIELLKILTDKTVKNSKGIYDLWMLNESDLIQDLGKTFGERICLEESYKKFKGVK